MAIFRPNHGSEYEVTSLQNIKNVLGNHLDGFNYLEVNQNYVIARHKADPLGIGIGEVYGLPDGCISL